MFLCCFSPKQGSHGSQKLSSLNPPPIPDIFTPAAIRNGILIKFLVAKNVKNVQIYSQTTELWPKQLNVTFSVSEWVSEWESKWGSEWQTSLRKAELLQKLARNLSMQDGEKAYRQHTDIENIFKLFLYTNEQSYLCVVVL